MKRSKIMYLLLICVALAATGWALVRFYRAVKMSLSSTACVTTVSPRCSDATTVALESFVEHAVMQEQMPLRQLAAAVHTTFGHCSNITCRQKPSGLVQVAIDVDDPTFIVNEDCVLTEQGHVVPRDFFVAETVASLPHMKLVASGVEWPTISPALQTFLQRLPNALLTQYTIDHTTDEEVWLSNHDETMPSYVCSVETVFDEPLLGRCAQVVTDLEQQQALTKKKARTAWVLDLRFDKQVILYPRMGGQVHG